MRRLFITILIIFFTTSTVYGVQITKEQPLTYKILTTVVSVGTSATALPTTAMAGRNYVLLQNVGTATIYVGDANVTADTTSTGGTQILPYGFWYGEYDSSVTLYGIVASGTQNMVIEEGK